jgi:hypothetical protein
MAVTLKNLSGAQYGVESAETGVEIQSFEVRYCPEFKELFPNRQNQTTGFATTDKLSIEVSLEANVKGSTGIMAIVHTTAATVANDTNTFQVTPGGLYMDEVTESQSYNGWRKVSMKLTANPECA